MLLEYFISENWIDRMLDFQMRLLFLVLIKKQ